MNSDTIALSKRSNDFAMGNLSLIFGPFGTTLDKQIRGCIFLYTISIGYGKIVPCDQGHSPLNEVAQQGSEHPYLAHGRPRALYQKTERNP